MGRKRTPGLYQRGGIWHIDKTVLGKRICISTGEEGLAEAERRLTEEVRKVRDAKQYGTRPRRKFSEALARYCEECGWSRSNEIYGAQLDHWVGHLDVSEVHMGSLQPMIRHRLDVDGVKAKSVNLALSMARAVLRRAAGRWIDEYGLTWLHSAPTIVMLPETDKAKAYPPSWEEERRLLEGLPLHYAQAALYLANTGLRGGVACRLEWQWERRVPELGRSVFIVPPSVTGVKNGQEWIIVHNKTAQSVIEARRGIHDRFVFTSARWNEPFYSLHNNAWRRAWEAAGLPTGREWKKGPHNLRHAFATRLRALGVPDETRDYLMHHKRDKDMSALYAIPMLQELQNAVDKLCDARSMGATVLRIAG